MWLYFARHLHPIPSWTTMMYARCKAETQASHSHMSTRDCNHLRPAPLEAVHLGCRCQSTHMSEHPHNKHELAKNNHTFLLPALTVIT
jgi:hypothetical protein